MTIKNSGTLSGRISSGPVPSAPMEIAEEVATVTAEPVEDDPYSAESNTNIPYAHATSLEFGSLPEPAPLASSFSRQSGNPPPPARTPIAYSTGAPPRPPPPARTPIAYSTGAPPRPPPPARTPIAYSTGASPRPPPPTPVAVATGTPVQQQQQRRNQGCEECCGGRTCCCITIVILSVLGACCLLPFVIVLSLGMMSSQILSELDDDFFNQPTGGFDDDFYTNQGFDDDFYTNNKGFDKAF